MQPRDFAVSFLPKRLAQGALFIGLAFCVLVAEAAAEKKCDDPLPKVTITAPTADVPEQFAAFSGIWKGIWDWANLCSRLAVTEVESNGSVKGIYTWGKGPGFQPGNLRFDSNIEEGKIKFGTYAKFTFHLNNEGELVGKRRWRQYKNSVVMQKVADLTQ